MDKNALKKIVHLLLVLGAILSQAMTPAAAEVNLDESANEALLVNPPRQHADWENILREAFRLLGWDDFRLLVAAEEGYVASHEILGTPLVVNLTIQTKSGTKEWSEMPNLSIGETKFHSHDAYTMTLRDVWGNVSGHSLEWEMNGLYYLVGKGSSKVGGYSGTLDELYDYAEALYSAAAGTTLQKGGACAGMTCSADHCGEDGMTLYYDCSCDPADGECYCFTKICSAGCDNQAGACRAEQTVDLCASVTCEPSCEDNISFSDGVCDPQTGACLYEQTQDCGLAGCNEDNGLCNNLSDLSVDKITVMQAVEGGKLAARKPTAVVVAFNWPDETRDAEVNVSLFIDGRGFQALRHTVKSKYSQPDLIRSKDLAIFHIPQGLLAAGEHQFQVEAVIADEMIIDPNLENNSKLAVGTFIPTRQINMLFVPIHSSVQEADIWRFYHRARAFLLNVYPVMNVSIAPPIDYQLGPYYSVVESMQIAADLDLVRSYYNAQPNQYADYAVGLFPDGLFGEGIFGFSSWIARRSVMVADGRSNNLAHEVLAHEMGHELWGDEYQAGERELGVELPRNLLIYDGQRKELENLQYSRRTYVNFMGLAGSVPAWVDPRTWDTLVSKFGSQLMGLRGIKALAHPLPDIQTGGPGFLVTGSISADDQVQGVSIMSLEKIMMEKSYEGGYWLEAYDRNNNRLNRVPIELEFVSGMPSKFITAISSDIGQTVSLKISHNEAVIWQANSSANAPTVRIEDDYPGSAPLTGSVTLTWQAQDEDGDALTYTVLYSVDGGTTWLPVASGLTENNLTLNLDNIPGGEDCRVRVLACDGWHTSSAISQTGFSVADKNPQMVIENPVNNQVFAIGEVVELSAFAYDKENGWIDGERISWRSSQDGLLGSGNYLSVDNLSPGRHTISTEASDSSGQPALAQVEIELQSDVSDDNEDMSGFYGILAIIAFILMIGAVVFLVAMRRKQKRSMVIIVAILLGIFVLCFIASVILLLFGGASTEVVKMERETPELTVADAPSLPLNPEPAEPIPAAESAQNQPEIQTQEGVAPVVISDDFSQQRGWPEVSEARYSAGLAEGGIYRMDFWLAGDTVPSVVLLPLPPQTADDVMVKVKAGGMNENGAYGLVCRANGDDLYGFHVANDGRYWLYKAVGGKVTTLDSGRHTAISEEFNQVEMRCIGSRITSLVNGTQVSQVEDADLKSGNAGLFAQPLGGPVVGAWSFFAVFDDFYAEFSAGEGKG